MKLWANVRLALGALAGNKTRSFLTLLGIIIGIAAVIAVMSIGRGAQATVTQQIQSTGTNLIFIRPGLVTQGGIRSSASTFTSLTLQDAEALADIQRAPSVLGVAPEVQSFGQAVVGVTNTPTRVIGVTPDYEWVRNYVLAQGDFITETNVQGRSMVAVLGSNIALTLFPDSDPIGQTIRINRRPFRVVGVLQSRGGTALGVQDDQVLMPITTVMARLQTFRTSQGAQTVNLINVQAQDSTKVDAAKQEVTAILRERHRVAEGTDNDFTLTTQEDILSALRGVTETFTIFLGAIAGISLLVGGIGIMNIMLVSVAERTREIGIRKAIGAKRRHILAQFLVEAVVLSALGGATGVALGWGISRAIGRFSLNGQRLPSVVSPDIVILAVGVSLAIGLFFGIYPASRAARLDPIQALRHE